MTSVARHVRAQNGPASALSIDGTIRKALAVLLPNDAVIDIELL